MQSLAHEYLTRKRKDNPGFVGRELTMKEAHELYLQSLKDITDYLCGAPNPTKAPGGEPYILSSHQWMFKFPSRSGVIDEMAERLKDIDSVQFADFEELIKYVEARKVKYFGDTCVYDFCLRYGWNHTPRLTPEKYVYIHSRPYQAAKHLHQLGYIKKLERCLPIENYSALLAPGMNAADVEHLLCVGHDQILKLNN